MSSIESYYKKSYLKMDLKKKNPMHLIILLENFIQYH